MTTLRLLVCVLMLSIFARSIPAHAQSEAAATEWFAIGQSEGGRPVETAVLGYGAERVLVVGPLAGDERQALGVVEHLARFLEAQPKRLAETTTTILRDPNPDGRADSQRTNARGVDLNRNFPTRHWRKIPDRTLWLSGDEPKSARETQTLIALVETVKPDRAIVFAESPSQEWLAPTASAMNWARHIERESSYSVAPMDLGQVSGSLVRYLDEREIPTIVVLVPRNVPAATSWNRLGPALVASFDTRRSSAPVPTPAAAPTRTTPSLSPVSNRSAMETAPVANQGPLLFDGANLSGQQTLFGPLEPIRRGGDEPHTIRSTPEFEPDAPQPIHADGWPNGYVPPQKPIRLGE